jgi:hypothetical protein
MNLLESLKRCTTVVADIRKFYADARKLEQYAQTRVTQKMAS